MKITNLEIKNFRNISYAKYALTQVNIISGRNGIGKTNTINALHYFLTNTLLTDSGSNSNDTSSILTEVLPNEKKPSCEITITLESGMKFTKILQEKWNKKRGEEVEEYGGTETLYYKNQAKITAKDFNKEMSTLFNIPNYESKKIDIFRTMIDPLYLFQKIDYKDLRTFIIDICGDSIKVKNEDILQDSKFEPIRNLLASYGQDESACRAGLKKQIKTIKDDIVSINGSIQALNTTGYDEAYKQILLDKMTELNTKLSDIKNSYTERVNYYNSKIKKMQEEKSNCTLNITNKYTLARNNLKNEFFNTKDKYLSKLLEAKERAIKESVDYTKDKLNLKLKGAETNLEKVHFNICQLQVVIEDYRTKNNQADERIKKGYQKIQEIESKEIAEIKCPNCGTIINQTEIENQFENKIKLINACKAKIAEIESTKISKEKIDELLEKYKQFEEERDSILQEIDTYTRKLKELEETSEVYKSPEVIEFEKIISQLEIEYNKQQLEIDDKYSKENDENIRRYDKCIEQVKLELDNLNLVYSNDSEEELNLKSELSEVKIKYENQAAKAKNLESKVLYEKQKDEKLKEQTMLEKLEVLVDLFIKTKLSVVTQKIIDYLGVKFIMLEDQINGGIKEVCYVLGENDIPYEQLSTSEKIKIGYHMINKINDILTNSLCDLPIICDKGESLDNNNLKKLKSKQTLISVVSNGDIQFINL